MKREWDIIEVLRHSRHDWLNKLQLIKGNLDLNRIDRAKAVIDEIVVEAQHETKLSNLHIHSFAALLLGANWENPAFILEYEVLGEGEPVQIKDENLTNWTQSFFLSLSKGIEVFQENHLSITIDPQPDGIRFFFDFRGIITNRELIERFLAEPQSADLGVAVNGFSDSELALEVFMPVN